VGDRSTSDKKLRKVARQAAAQARRVSAAEEIASELGEQPGDDR